MKSLRAVRPRYPDLQAYFTATGERQQDFAARVRCPQGYISKLARGVCIPRPGPVRARIVRAAGIPDESFRLLNLKYRLALAQQTRTEIAQLDQVVREAVQ